MATQRPHLELAQASQRPLELEPATQKRHLEQATQRPHLELAQAPQRPLELQLLKHRVPTAAAVVAAAAAVARQRVLPVVQKRRRRTALDLDLRCIYIGALCGHNLASGTI